LNKFEITENNTIHLSNSKTHIEIIENLNILIELFHGFKCFNRQRLEFYHTDLFGANIDNSIKSLLNRILGYRRVPIVVTY